MGDLVYWLPSTLDHPWTIVKPGDDTAGKTEAGSVVALRYRDGSSFI